MQDELYILVPCIENDRGGPLGSSSPARLNMLTRHEAKQAISHTAKGTDKRRRKAHRKTGKQQSSEEEVRSGNLTAESATAELAIIQQQYNESIETPKLTIETLREWDTLKGSDDIGSVRGVVAELRSLLTKLEWQSRNPLADITATRAAAEASLVEKQLKFAHDLSSKCTKVLSELETELDMFRDCMNHRLVFYKRLQAISDSVKPWKDGLQTTLDSDALTRFQTMEKKARDLLESQEGRRRFLKHLRDHANEDDSRVCVICQTSFEVGCSVKVRTFLTLAERRPDPLRTRLLQGVYQRLVDRPPPLTALQAIPALDRFSGHHVQAPRVRCRGGAKPALALAARSDPLAAGPSDTPGSPASTLRSKLYAEINKATLDQIKANQTSPRHTAPRSTRSAGSCSGCARTTRARNPSSSASSPTSWRGAAGGARAVWGWRREHPRGGRQGRRAVPEGGGRGRRFCSHAQEQLLRPEPGQREPATCSCAEPLVNPAVRAAGRRPGKFVHRIGQMRPTTVWMCLVRDLGRGRRVRHLGQSAGSRTSARAGASPPTPLPRSRGRRKPESVGGRGRAARGRRRRRRHGRRGLARAAGRCRGAAAARAGPAWPGLSAGSWSAGAA